MFVTPALVTTQPAQAQTFTTLYSFTGTNGDGYGPVASLVRDSDGNLYGTTPQGGTAGRGTVFKLDSTGAETILHSFTGIAGDGAIPEAGLVRDQLGNLYGTTSKGGPASFGTIFKVSADGTLTVLHRFTGVDGKKPVASLLRDSAGNLYGTTSQGGEFGAGTVFVLSPTRSETILYSFTGGSDGGYPYAGLVRDSSGNLYGTTYSGGVGVNTAGTVFEVDIHGTETVLHSFAGATDGRLLYSGLLRDKAGDLFGTTYAGGTDNSGIVFKLDAAGTETVLYNFAGGTDGLDPTAGLVSDAAGNLYGTTFRGGAFNSGTIFKLDTSGGETVLYNFTGGADGYYPAAGLIWDAAGNLFGTTQGGGAYSYGTIFELTP